MKIKVCEDQMHVYQGSPKSWRGCVPRNGSPSVQPLFARLSGTPGVTLIGGGRGGEWRKVLSRQRSVSVAAGTKDFRGDVGSLCKL